MDLKNASVLVTGGGSGLGAATAVALRAAGARIAVFDLNEENAKSIAARVGGVSIAGDVASEADGSRAVQVASETHGPIRALVNCAGVGTAARILGRDGPMPLDRFEKIVRINLVGTFNMMRLCAAHMAKNDPLADGERGAIISTGSIAAFEGQVGQGAYGASKGAVSSLTLPAARELASFGIRVLTIAPGLFLTPMMATLPEAIQKSLGDSIPFPKRLGRPDEFASLVQHCLENVHLNGEVIRLDGAVRLAAS